MGLLNRPPVRNALGLHSPSRCTRGPDMWVAGLVAGVTGVPAPPWSCRCSCRRCRLAHRPDSPPGLVLREEVTAAAMVAEMRRVADGLGIDLLMTRHPPGECEECDRRRAEGAL